MLQEFVRQQRIGGQLAHHDDFQAALAAAQAVLSQYLPPPASGLTQGTHRKGIITSTLVNPMTSRTRFIAPRTRGRSRAEAVGDVARRTTETDHGVLFAGFVTTAPTRLAYSLDLKSDIRTMTRSGQKAAARG